VPFFYSTIRRQGPLRGIFTKERGKRNYDRWFLEAIWKWWIVKELLTSRPRFAGDPSESSRTNARNRTMGVEIFSKKRIAKRVTYVIG
jgi:hypothetical protein